MGTVFFVHPNNIYNNYNYNYNNYNNYNNTPKRIKLDAKIHWN